MRKREGKKFDKWILHELIECQVTACSEMQLLAIQQKHKNGPFIQQIFTCNEK